VHAEPDAKQLGPAAAQHEVRVEADGSVSLRGPALLSEFLDSPEETRRVRSPDGWVRSTALRLHSPAPNQFALAE
jgi:long-subunit acyl-CoA synthetase (AMP-forming)